MEPEHIRFGGGAAATTVHPLVAILLLIAILLILVLPRSKAILPFILGFFTIPMGNVVVLGGFHFTALRLLILAGLAKMISSRKSSPEGKIPGGFNGVDQMVVLWSVTAVIVFCIQYRETQAVVRSMGDLLDTLGGYLAVRFLIQDGETVRRTIKVLATVCVINGVCMINEKFSHINVFGLLGGISTEVVVRDGHIRSEGAMGCLYAGAFAGVLIPLFVWLWSEGKSRMTALAGLLGATTMVITSHASTSILAFGGSLLALAFWPLRKSMSLVRWGLVIGLVSLHLVMKAPVWALIARIDLTGSSSGDQRYHLIDSTIRHFGDWWFLGCKNYNDWGWGMWDLCNQFVAVALTGGLLTLIFYIAIFKRSFKAIGTTRKLVDGNREQEWPLWCLSSALFATVVAHFGINYPAHLIMGFFSLVACISVATLEARQAAVQTVETAGQGQFAFAHRAAGSYLPLGARKQEAQHAVSNRKRERPISWLKA
jgi:hypothetical protein